MLSTRSQFDLRYQPLTRIGRGGMAEVFLAITRGSDVTKLVVLKRIWDELAADPDFVEMFLDEARLSARMSHPNVVQTYEVMESEGRLTMAMEYLDGQPLARVLNRLSRPGALTLAMRLRIIIDILAGLDHAHELTDYDGTPLGVVHRDVSPQNVFITYDGHVKLVDFGVAKTLAGAHQTRPGAIKGKLAYMAPEQLRGPLIDRRADIFSVGVMLWEMLAGRRLFQGMTEVTIVHHLSFGLPVPVLRGELTLPAGLEDICLRALSPQPADRFSTAAEMEEALRRVLPSVTDSHSRHLGKIVSIAFATERAERQLLIDGQLNGIQASATLDEAPHDAPAADTTPSLSLALMSLPAAVEPPPPRARFGGRVHPAVAAGVGLVASLLLALALPVGRRLERLFVAAPELPMKPESAAKGPPAPPPRSFLVPLPARAEVSALSVEPPAPERTDVRADSPLPAFVSTAPPDDELHQAHARRRPRSIEDGGWPDRRRRGGRHASSHQPGVDAFAVEVGASPPLARRREIDTDSPFAAEINP